MASLTIPTRCKTGWASRPAIRGGENLFPAEIENILLEHEIVAEVAVVGVPDPKFGEAVAAFVRVAAGARFDPPTRAAMAHAVMAKFGFEWVPISLEIKVSYFAPANPGRALAEAWIERAGGHTLFAEGRLTTLDGKMLAKGSSTISLIDAAKVQRQMTGS